MGFITCPKGHKYNDKNFDSCPYCKKQEENPDSLSARIGRIKSMPQIEINATEAYKEASPEGVTVGVFCEEGFSPVTGWLVCTKGVNRGRDYRIRRGKNFAGRSPSCDIYIAGDPKISARHFTVVFDPESTAFILLEEKGCLLYLNGALVQSSSTMKEGDIVSAGDTEFQLAVFCKEGFSW